jgi:hypothetical protein
VPILSLYLSPAFLATCQKTFYNDPLASPLSDSPPQRHRIATNDISGLDVGDDAGNDTGENASENAGGDTRGDAGRDAGRNEELSEDEDTIPRTTDDELEEEEKKDIAVERFTRKQDRNQQIGRIVLYVL